MQDHRMGNRADMRAAGCVTSTTVRYSPRWAASAPRAIGVAPGADIADGPSVKVTYADGTSEIKPHSAFNKRTRRVYKRDTVTPRKQTEVERYGLTNNIGEDFS
jgi:hypothetical protein